MPLIVGLGNPGSEYKDTPHNVGFEVLERLARRMDVRFRKSRSGRSEEATVPGPEKLVLLRPLAYMNLSGHPVRASLEWHRIPLSGLLVVCDDVNLPLGHVRLRDRGGAGGQKGLLSIIEKLGTDEFARLRIGVGGGYPGADVARHVLGRFPEELRETIEAALEQAADAVECYLQDGLATAMNRFNTKRQSKKSSPSGGERPPDELSPEGES